MTPIHECTPCQLYGHHFVEGRCEDCGERCEEDTQPSDEELEREEHKRRVRNYNRAPLHLRVAAGLEDPNY